MRRHFFNLFFLLFAPLCNLSCGKTSFKLSKQDNSWAQFAGRALYDDEFVTTELTLEDAPANVPREWKVKVLDHSYFAKRAAGEVYFSSKSGEQLENKEDPSQEYYQINIKKQSGGLYELWIVEPPVVKISRRRPGAKKSCQAKKARPAHKQIVALDDKVILRGGTYSTLRQLLRLPPPVPNFRYHEPLLSRHGSIYAVLGTITGFNPQKLPLANNATAEECYVIRYESPKNKPQTFTLSPGQSLIVYAYDKCRNRYKLRKIKVPATVFFDQHAVFKPKVKEDNLGKLRSRRNLKIPSYNLAKTVDGKRYALWYKPLDHINRQGVIIFDRFPTLVINKINELVKIKVLDENERLQEVEFSYLEMRNEPGAR